MTARKKLIEVALPLEAINKASAREKSIRHGHPSTLHLWWARRPLAACRAVLFAQLVDDPSSDPVYRKADGSVDEDRAGVKRAELFNLIEELVKWENTNNTVVIDKARAEIARCVASRKIELGELHKETIIFGPDEGKTHPDGPLPKDGRFTAWQIGCRLASPIAVNHFLATYAPPVLDPFAGGGSIPLEAQRLGLRAHASDLNPVAVLINKALIEIPPKFASMPPVNHESRSNSLEPLGARASCPQSTPKDHKEWYSRGYLPHFDHPDLIQTITFRLYDSVPSSLIQNWQDELNLTQNVAADPRRLATLRERIARYEDAGHGACFLKNENIAAMVEKAFLHFNNERYRLLAWVVMPNHIHVMIEALAGWLLKDIIHSWKSYTAKQANQILNRSGPFWSPDYFDRFIRDESHFLAAKEYMENNPVKAGLCSKPEEWPFSSARRGAAPGNVSPGNVNPGNAGILPAQNQENAAKMAALPGEAPGKALGGAGFWAGATGLAEDVRYYGRWMKDEAEKRIGHLYPKVAVTKEMAKDRPDLKPYVGQELTVIAWLWARTVPSPDPSVGGKHVPLVRSFWLSKKKGKEAYVQPIVDRAQGTFEFVVKVGKSQDGFNPNDGTVVRTGARCLIGDSPIPFDHIREAGKRGEMKTRLMAIVCEGNRGRVYLSPDDINVAIADCGLPAEYPLSDIPNQALGFRVQLYGMDQHWKLFTPRQLTALTTFSDLVSEARDQVLQDATAAGTLPDDNRPLTGGGLGPQAYADAVATYLGLVVSRTTNSLSTLSIWSTTRGQSINAFGRQALPMTWDFPEVNPFAGAAGDYAESCNNISKIIPRLPSEGHPFIEQLDARTSSEKAVIATDPPYYDNIGYADLSDFFYVWLRRSLKGIYPELLSTMLTPKAEEMIASPYRHGGSKVKAAAFFEKGLGSAIGQWRKNGYSDYPTTIFYAFKQAETDKAGTASTGWETFLSGVIDNSFVITGTWPLRTERDQGLKTGTNVLASSVVLACVPRLEDASMATRREFLNALKRELPEALRLLQSGNIAPVDLAQAAIGPGMALFSRYAKVIEADGASMTVRTALTLINQMLDEVLAEQEGEFDAHTRWAVAWFEQYGVQEGPYGVAETLSKAKNTSVQGLADSGIVNSRAGSVQLLGRNDLPADWDPSKEKHLTGWEAAQHLILTLEQKGESGAADLLRQLGGDYGDKARDLAYRLFSICERKKWAHEALAYNSLVVAWPELVRLANQMKPRGKPQGDLFE